MIDITKQLSRKSNIKDVCALLDMKSSKYCLDIVHHLTNILWYCFGKFLISFFYFIDTEEVNKALDEIHDEMDKVVVTKPELNDAL